jgi:cytoskeletal protein RodZ
MHPWNSGKKVLAGLGSVFILGLFLNAAHPPSNASSAPPVTKASTQSKVQKLSPPKVQTKKVETKQVAETQSIPFQSTTQNDPSLTAGKTVVAIQGVNGTKTITYNVTYTDGQETAREKVSEVVTTQPINQVDKVGTYVLPASAAPAGPTARCNDGTYSYSAHHQGTCSHHSGVAEWL